ncbi:gamma-glutamyl-gamma-aminobutyrate hydrolase family protein [Galactobacter sp.]|uniref:gamma-glutamyl-gamma-aminobutyrate hydrolase family protein n=1 Tax=Galactobacter sp. TaxID=2676125 RepID=UPI0025C137AD|nr:gamma-glutamyl-gamma-aminobutyrate hydrolase family protein [Galactobacter sp.]
MRIALLHLRNARPHAPEFNETLNGLNQGAVAAVEALGWEYTLVASGELPVTASADAALAADAVVLLGGEDVHPALYNGPLDYPEVDTWDLKADAAHLAVVAACTQARKPLLGICRGLQIINVAFGGTLVQHLELPGHRLPGHGLKTFAPTRPEFVGIVPDGVGSPSAAASPAAAGGSVGGLAGDVADEPTLCTHHQAVDRVGEGLLVTARSEHGVVEALVHRQAPITGVQWHPEHPDVLRTQLVALLQRLERQVAVNTVPSS